MLNGTATLHTATASAAEPATLVVVAAGLLAARALGRVDADSIRDAGRKLWRRLQARKPEAS